MQLHAPAKINLALSVGSALSSGMHPIASWMVAVEFGDTLTLEKAVGDQSTFDLAFADDAPAPPPGGVTWPLEKDLVFRAHALLQVHAGRNLPTRVVLRKRIPTGAGLGGGSSDAAAALVGINQLFDLRLDEDTLTSLAMRLGSDVGFLVGAMRGKSFAIVAGLGERIEPVAHRGTIHLALAFPDVDCPTAAVYKAFDHLHAGAPRAVDELRVRTLATRSPLPPDAPFNDLAPAAFHVRPVLADVRHRLERGLRRPVHVTGSGSTLFVIATDPDDAARMARQATEISRFPSVATHTRAISAPI